MDVIAILKQRDRQTFDWLYRQYAGVLFGIIRKQVEEKVAAENLLLETFVTAWRNLDEFDGRSGSLFIWMLRIARTKVAEYTRDEKQENQQREVNNNEIWMPSFQQQTAGQKQYSNS